MPNPLSVAHMIKKADDRLYRTIMFAPIIARFVYFLGAVVVAVTGFVLVTRWDIKELKDLMKDKADVHEVERNAKIVDGIYKDFYHRDPPPR